MIFALEVTIFQVCISRFIFPGEYGAQSDQQGAEELGEGSQLTETSCHSGLDEDNFRKTMMMIRKTMVMIRKTMRMEI